MSESEYSRNLRERFRKTFGAVDERALVMRSRAIVGTDALPDSPEGKLALTAINKLKIGAEPGPTPAEFAALEYMIRAMRPAPLVRHGVIDPRTGADFLAAFPEWAAFSAAFPQQSQAIGCIFKLAANQPPKAEATGFLVAKNILMTNAHVLTALSGGVNELQKGQAMVRFGCEAGVFDEDPPVDILNVIACSEALDACLLLIDEPRSQALLQFSTADISTGVDIAAAGFPYADSRNPAFVGSTFVGGLGFKRVAPGTIVGTQPSTSTVYHDCSTLGGNSGSPLLSMKDNSVVALHTGGGFLWKNTATSAKAITAWMTDRGVKVGALDSHA